MKRIILLIGFVSVTFFYGCNDGFLNRFPKDQITEQNYWHTAKDLRLYANQFYPIYIVGFGTGFGQTVEPYGTTEGIAYRDAMSDNAAPHPYNKVSADQYTDYLTGSSDCCGWNFSNIRNLNYFLVNYKKADVPAAKAHIYAGEILFFKAWDYFKKVKLFGDVPWLVKPLKPNSPHAKLYPHRTPRDQVMDSVMAVLNKAIKWLPAKGSERKDRLNKDVARFLKMRIGLFVGTYRKYHKELNLDGKRYLKICVKAAHKLMNSGRYKLYSTGHPDKDYHNLFSQYSYADNSGIILWRNYSADKNYGAAFSRYFAQNLYEQWGATQSLVNAYLAKDGKPISVSPLYKGDDSIQQEFKNRDPRLSQTIAMFGTYNLAKGVMGADNAPVPNIRGLSGNKCLTGYRIAKWFLNDPADWARVTNGEQAAPIFRYAEVLLDYAEAKYELGQINQGIINKTLNAIRARVAMPPLKIGNVPNDPHLESLYSKYVGYVPSPLLLAIRRARRVELAFEGHRWNDLMRWKAGHFMEMTVKGIPFVQSQFPSVKVSKDVILGKDDHILPYAKVLPNGRKWENKEYLFPIPIKALVINRNLKQNPGWQSP